MIVEFEGGPIDGRRRDLIDGAWGYKYPQTSAFTGKRTSLHVYARVDRLHLGAIVFEYRGESS